jgi:hypothetical protein
MSDPAMNVIPLPQDKEAGALRALAQTAKAVSRLSRSPGGAPMMRGYYSRMARGAEGGLAQLQ